MRNGITFTVAVVLLLSFTACDNGGTTPTLGNTPAQALEELERAFNDLDAELLERLLDTDFTFHFDEDDIGNVIGDYVIPATWDREDFLAACGNMFTEAYSIDFSVVTTEVDDPAEDATEFTAEDVQVSLLVMVDSTNGYLAHGFCDFRFVNEGADGTDGWVIADWWDRSSPGGSGGRGTTPTSFGVILVTFR